MAPNFLFFSADHRAPEKIQYSEYVLTGWRLSVAVLSAFGETEFLFGDPPSEKKK